MRELLSTSPRDDNAPSKKVFFFLLLFSSSFLLYLSLSLSLSLSLFLSLSLSLFLSFFCGEYWRALNVVCFWRALIVVCLFLFYSCSGCFRGRPGLRFDSVCFGFAVPFGRPGFCFGTLCSALNADDSVVPRRSGFRAFSVKT